MPRYEYRCEANNRNVEVKHTMSESLNNWGELCDLAKIEPGDTPLDSSVRRIISCAPQVRIPVGNSKLKEKGFTKLVRRDQGVYENVTATGSEKRYFRSDDPTSMPHIHKKIED